MGSHSARSQFSDTSQRRVSKKRAGSQCLQSGIEGRLKARRRRAGMSQGCFIAHGYSQRPSAPLCPFGPKPLP
eukprot:s2025_g21.t1